MWPRLISKEGMILKPEKRTYPPDLTEYNDDVKPNRYLSVMSCNRMLDLRTAIGQIPSADLSVTGLFGEMEQE